MLLKNVLKIGLLSLSLIGLSHCTSDNENSNSVRLGVISGPEAEVMNTVKKYAKEQFNLEVKVVEFSDYAMPNRALAEGSIDANLFQHQPYLDEANHKMKYNLVSIGKTYSFPMGIYSKKHSSLVEAPPRALIGIPSDPSNQGRALKLLAKSKLINIPLDIEDINLTPFNISYNPLGLKFASLDAAQLPRALNDLDYAIINTNYALGAGLKAYPDALFMEEADSPYANLLVVKASEAEDKRFKQLLYTLRSDEVQNRMSELFKDQALPAW